MGGSSVIKFGGLIALMLLISSCKPENRSVLVGTYVADYEVAKETLVLNASGTFFQHVVIKATSESDETEGRWTYDEATGYLCLCDNYMHVLNGFKKINSAYNKDLGLLSVVVDCFFGYVFIEFNEFLFYKKVSSSTQ